MKTIYKIAKTELQTLFYSPVAWLIIVVFAFQAAMIYVERITGMVKWQSLGWPLNFATLSIFTSMKGLFSLIQSYLYLYIPLLTMGVMSREIGSGSIKLLYSSPLTNAQIILGKYLALMIYGLVLTGILGVFGIHAMFVIDHAEIPVILTGLLGLYLLMCAYAAIGLFMSSLTSYAVVAAIGTLATFAILGYVKTLGQDIAFVRDITYWLAISGRSDTFISGLLTSEDVLYFILVIGLFLGFSILKLQTGRQRNSWMVNFGRYAAVVLVVMLLGYFSALPKLKVYYDVTRTKVNTLTRSSQDVINKLTDGVTITTYSNMLDGNSSIALPIYYKADVAHFEQYIRFKPGIKLKYEYYYHHADNPMLEKLYPHLSDKQRLDTLSKIYNWDFDISPYQDIAKQADLSDEKYRFVRVLERENGRKTFLRIYDDMMKLPSEAEITAAFKRLVMELPVVGFLTGHGERESDGEQDRGYRTVAQEKTFRYSLINQGFDFTNVTLDKPVPANIRILVIAELKKSLTEIEMENLQHFIDKGGNLLIAGEPGRQEQMNPVTAPLGVQFLPGTLVRPSKKFQSDLLTLKPTKEGYAFSYYFEDMAKRSQVLTMPAAVGLSFTKDKGFEVKTLFTSDSTKGWNELETTNFADDSVICNAAAGEAIQPFPTVLALSRKINNREQRIMITGDADWLSNAELGMSRKDVSAANFALSNAAFYWLSDGEVPIDMRRDPATDTSLAIGPKGSTVSGIFLKWLFPLALMGAGILIWIRRRGR